MAPADHFDLVVVGAGPAGEKGAAQAAYFGKRVAVIEAEASPGGIAVKTAGIPTKTLRESAIHLSGLGQDPRDLSGDGTLLERLMARTAGLTTLMTNSVRRNLTRHGVSLVRGRARLLGAGRVLVSLAGGGSRLLEARTILLATGGRPVRPSWMRAGDPGVRDSEDILSIPRLPESLLVVGAGAVGCEYASIFACLGVRVTLACRTDRVLDRMDADSSRVLAESFNGLGIRVVPRAEVVSLAREGDRLVAGLAGGSTLAAEMVLVATGRKAATEGLGLEEAGVELRADGSVKVDERYETTAAGVYAAGDVIGTPALAAAAMEEARVAVCHAFGFAFKQAVDGLVPSYVFSIPEVASVGMSEDEARRAGIDIEVGQAAFSANARARISGFADGLLKLVFRASDRRLVGVHIVGEMASELIHLGQMVLREGQGLGRFIETTFAVPTRSEAYKYAAYDGLMRLARRGRERRAGGG